MVAHASNQQGKEDEEGESRVRGQPGLKKKKKKRKEWIGGGRNDPNTVCTYE
jgi:hypothetical protein